MSQLGFIALVGVMLLVAHLLRGKPPAPTSVDPEVIAAFRQLYRRQLILAAVLAPFFVWVLHSPTSGGALHRPLLLVVGMCVVGLCVYTYRYWRCPKCGAYLGRNPMYNWRCPSCGTALREPKVGRKGAGDNF